MTDDGGRERMRWKGFTQTDGSDGNGIDRDKAMRQLLARQLQCMSERSCISVLAPGELAVELGKIQSQPHFKTKTRSSPYHHTLQSYNYTVFQCSIGRAIFL